MGNHNATQNVLAEPRGPDDCENSKHTAVGKAAWSPGSGQLATTMFPQRGIPSGIHHRQKSGAQPYIVKNQVLQVYQSWLVKGSDSH